MKNDKIQINIKSSERLQQPNREKRATNERTEIFSLVKTINGYPRREKKSGLRTKMKSFHSGYSDQKVRIKVYPF